MDGAALTEVRQQLALLGRPASAGDIAKVLQRSGRFVSDQAVWAIQSEIDRGTVGIGPLEPLLARPGLTDILVNGPDQVYVDCGAGLERVDLDVGSPAELRALAVRLAASAGRRLDDGSPFVDARLTNGLRFHAILAGIATPGTCLSFRVPARRVVELEEWVEQGALHRQAAAWLARLVERRTAFLVSGGTGSGKTTLLGSLLSRVPDDERLVIVEDSRELAPRHPHVVALEARPANAEGAGLVTLTDLVRQALRMRPGRLIGGEVRGAALRDFLQAMNTGHEGGCGTIHANSAGDVLARLEALAALAGLGRSAVHAQIRSALSVLVHLSRVEGRRFVSEIALLVPQSDGLLRVATAWRFSPGSAEPGEASRALADLLA